MSERPGVGEKINVLFLHAQAAFGADSAIHVLLMRFLEREQFAVHAAYTNGEGAGVPVSMREIEQIPDVYLRPMSFVPGFRERSRAEVLRSLSASLKFPIDYASLALYCRRHRIRVIHSTDRPRDSAYAVSLARLVGARSVVHVHIKWSDYYSKLACWAVRNADAVFGISNYVSKSVVDFGRAPSDVYTVLNGIDTARWDPSRVSRDKVRLELGIPPNAPLLASVSRLFVHKGTEQLLRSFVLVRQALPDARLLIVGEETPFSQGFKAQMQDLARELGVGDAVVFTGARQDVPEIMAACDVFSMPSDEEPFGLVYLEAMAMERPVLAIGNGGTPEVVEHGECGLLSSHLDVPAFAANAVALLGDPVRRARMGANGRARVLNRFSAERMAADAGRTYRTLLANGR
jgi:glycosyltransferase involved in cell wall biosynthesis